MKWVLCRLWRFNFRLASSSESFSVQFSPGLSVVAVSLSTCAVASSAQLRGVAEVDSEESVTVGIQAIKFIAGRLSRNSQQKQWSAIQNSSEFLVPALQIWHGSTQKSSRAQRKQCSKITASIPSDDQLILPVFTQFVQKCQFSDYSREHEHDMFHRALSDFVVSSQARHVE